MPPITTAITQKIVNPDVSVTANEMGAAILAVLALHKPTPWYEECQQHPVPNDDADGGGDFWEAHRYVGDIGMLVCEETRIEDRCAGCTPDGADDDTVMSVKFPCPTLLAIAETLGVSTAAEASQ